MNLTNQRELRNKNRAFKGIWIPAEIWLNDDLSVMEKLFFIEIDSLDNKDGCFANNGHFADFFNISKGRASQIINELIDRKYITAKYIKEGKQIKDRILRSNMKYMVAKDPIKNIKGGCIENDEPPVKEIKDPPLENDEEKDNKCINTKSSSSNSDHNNNFSIIVDIFEKNGFGTINITTKEMIIDYIETYNIDWVIEAMKIAVKSNQRNLRYVGGILKNWKANGKDDKREDNKSPHKGMKVF